MRCCIIPIAAHRPTRLRRTGTIPLLLQFIDPTGSEAGRSFVLIAEHFIR